jgi:hypothetical protein
MLNPPPEYTYLSENHSLSECDIFSGLYMGVHINFLAPNYYNTSEIIIIIMNISNNYLALDATL